MPDTINPLVGTTTEVKISELPAATAASTTDQLEANQSGVSRSITLQQLADAIRLNYGAGVSTWLTNPTSANLAAAITDETGSAGALVFSNTPSLSSPTVGTQASTDNSNKAASTAFVTSAISAIPPPVLTGYLPVNNPSATGQFTLATVANTQPMVITGYTLTGTNVQSAFGVTGTLNTTGAVDVINFTITDTAHGSGSTFIRLKGGPAASINQFVVDMTGDMQCGGSTQVFNSSAPPAGGNTAFGMWLGNFTGGNLGVMFGTGAPTISTFGKYGSIYLNAASPGIPYYNSNGTTGWDQLVGLAATQTLTNKSATTPTAGDNSTKIATTAFVAAAVGAGSPANIQVFGTAGTFTYTPTSGMKYCIIEALGGGGGGGGTANSPASIGVGGGGGGAGSCSRMSATAATIGASQSVVVGAAGAAGAAGNNAGGNGGDTSVGVLCIGKGGTGGSGNVGNQPGSSGGLGGVAGTGTVTTTGAPGGTTTITTNNGLSGTGGSSSFGGGGVAVTSPGGTATGNPGTGHGSGGSGGCSSNGAGTAAGGAGTAGYVVITEHF
jgi:hypothetical protein